MFYSQGVYNFFGFYANGKDWPVMIMPSGDYMAELTFMKEGVEIFRLRGYASIINI